MYAPTCPVGSLCACGAVNTRPVWSGKVFFNTCNLPGLRSGSVTKFHTSSEDLLELLEPLADELPEELDDALPEALDDVDVTTGALLDAHSSLLADPEDPDELDPLLHAASTSIKAPQPANIDPRDVNMSAT